MGQRAFMSSWCRILAGNRRFQEFILGAILFNAVVMGLATFEGLGARYGWFFAWATVPVS